MDYRYLKAFRAAATQLNFTQAAAELQISVSALSRQITLLEKSCGGDLFFRNTRQVSLTPLGRKLFSSVEAFELQLKADHGEAPLRIGCLESVFKFFLAEQMERRPKLFEGPLDIVIASPQLLEEEARFGKLDLILTNLEAKAAANLTGFRLFRENLSRLGPSTSKRQIVFSAFENAYSDDERSAKNRIRVNSYDATVELCQRKIGQALVALPSGMKNGASVNGGQWIYAVSPTFREVPPRLDSILKYLRKRTSFSL